MCTYYSTGGTAYLLDDTKKITALEIGVHTVLSIS